MNENNNDVVSSELVRQFDRLPPSNTDAEACVLASMLLDRECVPAVRATLTRDAFYHPDHQILYDVICGMVDAGRDPDAILLRSELVRRNLLEEVGGSAYLAKLIDTVPSAAHAEHYATEVRETWVWREGIRACNEFLRAAYAPHAGIGAAAEQARRTADAISEASVSGHTDGFRRIGDVAAVVYDRLGRQERRFLPTGLTLWDQHSGGVPVGGMTFVGGRPGTGKSQTARQIAYNHAASGGRAAIISVEETDEKIAGNLLAQTSGVKNSRIMYGTVAREDFPALAAGLQKLSDLDLYTNDDPVSLSQVVAAVTVAVTKYRCEIVVVDYLQLIDPEKGDNENREITIVSRSLKATFKRLDVPGVVAVQLNRGNEGQAGAKPRLPMLKDLRGSGSLEQDGDLIVLLHREDAYHKGDPNYTPTNQIQAVIAKNKCGQTGTIPLLFDGDGQTIRDWPERDVFASDLPPGM